MRLLRTTRSLFLATLLGTALLATAEDEKDHAKDQDVVSLETAEVEPQRGGDDPAMQEVRTRVGVTSSWMQWWVRVSRFPCSVLSPCRFPPTCMHALDRPTDALPPRPGMLLPHRHLAFTFALPSNNKTLILSLPNAHHTPLTHPLPPSLAPSP